MFGKPNKKRDRPNRARRPLNSNSERYRAREQRPRALIVVRVKTGSAHPGDQVSPLLVARGRRGLYLPVRPSGILQT
ncbi:hypothetical protein chiPu_0003253 [Chiloscyllium punctatum]|uniref:Uncharacterized protein n=1 Tax=Chiloscyllium punctatum TaxID=137246 RepID=A0A401S388_CHIPU|nr:hypothetical protein [Chiloscyllium punctatum]